MVNQVLKTTISSYMTSILPMIYRLISKKKYVQVIEHVRDHKRRIYPEFLAQLPNLGKNQDLQSTVKKEIVFIELIIEKLDKCESAVW